MNKSELKWAWRIAKEDLPRIANNQAGDGDNSDIVGELYRGGAMLEWPGHYDVELNVEVTEKGNIVLGYFICCYVKRADGTADWGSDGYAEDYFGHKALPFGHWLSNGIESEIKGQMFKIMTWLEEIDYNVNHDGSYNADKLAALKEREI